jgi:hypothetical protein
MSQKTTWFQDPSSRPEESFFVVVLRRKSKTETIVAFFPIGDIFAPDNFASK